MADIAKMKREQKKELVQKLKEKIEKSKAIYLADYRGLTTAQLSQLRNQIADQEGEFKITKNTLLKIALQSSKHKLPTKDLLEGPTATLFSFKDEVAPLRILASLLKTTGIGQLKGGFFGENFLSQEDLEKLSQLPDRPTLIGQLIGSLYSPLYQAISVLQANLRNLVFALEQIKERRPA